jgi:phosphate transport system substrate-binding protein
LVDRSTNITVGISGTGGGFKKFCRGETDISNASRPIKANEVAACTARRISFIEIPVAYDGLAVIVNPKNHWASTMTVAELKTLWEPEAQGTMMKWSQIRAGWPDKEIRLFGPGVDSGTFDYFTEAIVGHAQASRGDFTASEDDNVLVQGVATDPSALGYFGFAYYEENKARLKLVAIDDGTGAIAPSTATVGNASYALSRPIFIYVSVASLKRPGVNKFVQFYLTEGGALATEVGYIALPPNITAMVTQRVNARVIGSMYQNESVGTTLGTLLNVTP